MRVVVDASLVAKWVVAEEYGNEALALLEKWAREELEIVSPHLLSCEVSSAIRKRVQRGELTWDEGREALGLFLEVGVELMAPPNLPLEAWEVARRFNLSSIYDSYYLALAKSLECELWTADRTLYNALQGQLPWVHGIWQWRK